MSFLSGIFSGGTGNLIKTVGDVADQLITSDDERLERENERRRAEMDHRKEMRSLDIKETELYLQDTSSAREFQSLVQDSENSGWLAKNIQPFLAILLVAATFGIFAKVLFGGIDPNNAHESSIIMLILGALVGTVTQIVSYFFGSSKGGDAQALRKSLSEYPAKAVK